MLNKHSKRTTVFVPCYWLWKWPANSKWIAASARYFSLVWISICFFNPISEKVFLFMFLTINVTYMTKELLYQTNWWETCTMAFISHCLWPFHSLQNEHDKTASFWQNFILTLLGWQFSNNRDLSMFSFHLFLHTVKVLRCLQQMQRRLFYYLFKHVY